MYVSKHKKMNLGTSKISNGYDMEEDSSSSIQKYHPEVSVMTDDEDLEDGFDEKLPDPDDNKVYICTSCNREFSALSSLKRHMSTHDPPGLKTRGKNPVICEVCDKPCRDASNLKLHMTKHTQEMQVTCDICGKGLRYKTYLKIHMRVHTGEKPYACHVCDKRFAQKSTLRVHLPVHGNKVDKRKGPRTKPDPGIERPFKCDQCDKAYDKKQTLYVHRKVHKDKSKASCSFIFSL